MKVSNFEEQQKKTRFGMVGNNFRGTDKSETQDKSQKIIAFWTALIN